MKRFAISIPGERPVYYLANASTAAAAATAEASRIGGEPKVYRAAEGRDYDLDAYEVAADFDGYAVPEDAELDCRLVLDRTGTAIVKLVIAVSRLPNLLSVDESTGAFALDLGGGEKVEYSGGSDWTLEAADGREATIEYDLSQIDAVKRDLATYIEVLASDPAGEADDVADLGRAQLADRDAA